MLKCCLFSFFHSLYSYAFFSNLQHSLYYPEEKGKKTFDRKEVSTELCGFASLHANTYYETVFPPPPNYCLNY